MKIIDDKILNELSQKAKESSRKRMNLNYHDGNPDLIQRMLNAMEPSTYVRPHKHENPDKREIFIALKGSFAIILFDDKGQITDYVFLDRNKGIYAIEIPPKKWHMIISLEENAVYYEIKDGPYDVLNDKHFAEWAPEEGSDKSLEYLERIKKLLKPEVTNDRIT